MAARRLLAVGTTPLEYERILTEDDFARIRELRLCKLVDELMRKHGLKSAAKKERLLAAAEEEAEEALTKLVSPLSPHNPGPLGLVYLHLLLEQLRLVLAGGSGHTRRGQD